MKSDTWDETLLAEHRAHLRRPAAVAAFDALVRAAIELPRYACAPGWHGAIRDFRYDDKSSRERPFAFIVNRSDLLFYVRSSGLQRVSGGFKALKATFASATENSRGEWTVRIASKDDADRLNMVLLSAYASPDRGSDDKPDGKSREDVLEAGSIKNSYLATTFRVESPNGHIDIRVGEKHPRIDALLSHHNATEWAYITAWNPGSQPVAAEINSVAHAELIDLVGKRALPYYEGDGIPDNLGWPPERSVWIAGITRREALTIGARFGQNAIVVGELGGIAELLFCEA